MTVRGTGAAAWRDALQEAGASVVFGYPGGAVLPLYEALRTSRMRHVLVRHEAAAAYAASGYARLSGRAGVCLATSGPGATNLLTGIANAYMDSVPLVAFTGQVARELIGTDAFQEVDIIGASQPFVKHSLSVRSAADMVDAVREAFALASAGRQGPVLVDIPVDVAYAPLRGEKGSGHLAGIEKPLPMEEKALARAAALLRESERPAILAGGGAVRSGACGALLMLAEKLHAPVAMTLMGLGAIPASHPLHVGMLGAYGRQSAREAMQQCDTVLALGVRMGERATDRAVMFAERARVIHIDMDVAELDKNIRAHLPVAAEAAQALRVLLADDLGAHRPWFTGQADEPEEKLTAAVRALCDAAPDAVIVTDVGLHQMAIARWYPFEKPDQLLTSGGLGAMGFGLPAAIGAMTALQEAGSGRRTVVVTGDGSLQMHLAELGVAMQEKLPLKVLLINDGTLGMVASLQDARHQGRHFAVALRNPDFGAIARAYGLEAHTVKKNDAAAGCAWLMRGKARLLEICMAEQ